jgi:FdhD protein
MAAPRLSSEPLAGAPAPRPLAEEAAVALVYNGTTQAVMMATPADLEDFAAGFTLTEGIARDLSDIRDLEVVEHPQGIECRMWLAEDRAEALAARRRAMAGPVGCGLCGIDSLEAAVRPAAQVTAPLALPRAGIPPAMEALRAAQPLHDETRAVHAAGFWIPGEGLVAVREDVGRHNALDKLAGALARAGRDGRRGAVLLTSRVSVEMVQKTAALGAPVLVAVSAPTAAAVRLAEEAGLTLVARARGAAFEIAAHPHRIVEGPPHVA